MSGKLYLCATPIGNLEDITMRVVRILGEADVIAAEDTRNSIKLLNHFHIKTPMTSYHEFNKYDKAKELVRQMKAGRTVALITDAGTPAVSDPGEVLVGMCVSEGVEVTSLPGPSACVTALALSGLPTGRFCFEGFLPSDKKARRIILDELRTETRTIILYEAPHHLRELLKELAECLGDRPISICRELTKRFETVTRTTLFQAAARYGEQEPRGEYVLVLQGRSREEMELLSREKWLEIPAAEHVRLYEEQGCDRKEAMKKAAADRGVPKRQVYKELLSEKEDK